MSLKHKKYATIDQRALRVLAACGKAPVAMRAMDSQERAAVAALCDDDGRMVVDGREKFRLLMVEHYERLKAVDAELE